MPHLDPSKIVERAYAIEQARKARIAADRAENEARIREQVEVDPPVERGCKCCGDPYAPVDENGECDLCVRDSWADAAKEKLSPEELYPEHFPDPDDFYDE